MFLRPKSDSRTPASPGARKAEGRLAAKTQVKKQFRSRPILMERGVSFFVLEELVYKGQSLALIFSKIGWTGILDPPLRNVSCNIVREFYTQISDLPPESTSWDVTVRGVKVIISPHKIATFFRLSRPPLETGETLVPMDELYRALTGRDDYKSPNKPIYHRDLQPFFQALHLIVAANVAPRRDTTKLTTEQGQLLFRIACGCSIDLPEFIFQTIQHEAQSSSATDGLPFGLLITGILLDAGVEPSLYDELLEPKSPISIITLRQAEEEVRNLAELQRGQPARPSTQEASKGTSGPETRPLWFDSLLMEIKAQIAPLQKQLDNIESRLASMEAPSRRKRFGSKNTLQRKPKISHWLIRSDVEDGSVTGGSDVEDGYVTAEMM